jgi:hypothetical protein
MSILFDLFLAIDYDNFVNSKVKDIPFGRRKNRTMVGMMMGCNVKIEVGIGNTTDLSHEGS